MKPRPSCDDIALARTAAWICGAALWLAVPLFAQTASVEGQVTETLRGKPLPKVTITLRGVGAQANPGAPPQQDMYTTETDDHGHFLIDNMVPGRYTVMPSRQGFTPPPAVRGGSAPVAPPLLLEAGKRATVTLQLAPAGVISGRVLDSEGDPLRDVAVQAMRYLYLGGKRQLSPQSTGQTNDRGEYRVFNLPAGSYYLQATSQNRSLMAMGRNEEIRGTRPPQGFVPTYFPNARDAASAAPLELAVGTELPSVDIRLQAETVYTVRVKIPPVEPGQIFPNYNLQLRGGNRGFTMPNFSSFFVMNNNNTVEFHGVLPGSYMLTGTLRSTDRPEVMGYARQIVEVQNHDMELMAPSFNPGFDIAGSVQVDTAAPFPLDKLRVNLRPDETAGYIPNPSATVAADGAFQLHMVQPESYRLLTMPIPAGAYLKGVKLGNREPPDLQVDFSGGAAPLTILLGTDGGRIEGTVQNGAGDPLPRARVVLAPDGRQRSREDRLKPGISDAKGHYVFADVPPGEYRLFVWEDADPNAIMDPDFRKPYESQSLAVKVEPSATLTIPLKPIPVQ